MTFTLTATAEPGNLPPRVLLEATESDPDVPLQTCTFFRDGVALRFAASVTAGSALAYDYDAPFDVSLTYRADATESDALILDFTEAWPDLADWTDEVPGWSVSAGKATSSTDGSIIRRDLTGDGARVEGPAPTFTGSAGYVELSGWNGTTQLWAIRLDNGGSDHIYLSSGGATATTSHTLNAWTLDIGPTTIMAAGSGWSSTVANAYPTLTTTRIKVKAGLSGGATVAFLDDISVYRFPATAGGDVTDTDTAILTGITASWLTNSAQPDLAVSVTKYGDGDGIVWSPETRRETNARATTVQLDIEGSANVLTATTGPRKKKTWDAVLHCLTGAAADALDTVLANSAPLSLRKPAEFAYMKLDDGFYSVGDVTTSRVQTPWPTREEVTTFTLPFTPSIAPAFDVLWSWNYGTSKQTGLTYEQLAGVFPTYHDLLVGPTS